MTSEDCLQKAITEAEKSLNELDNDTKDSIISYSLPESNEENNR